MGGRYQEWTQLVTEPDSDQYHPEMEDRTFIEQALVFKLYTFLIKCSVIPCICTWYFNEDYCCGVDRQMQSGDVTKRKADNGGAYIVIGHCHS